MPIQYATVYQITQLAPDWPFACVGLLPLFAGGVIIWGKRRFKWIKPHWLFAVFCCIFGVIWVGGIGSSILAGDWRAFTAYQKGDYRTVEGIVSDFHPMPYEGHQTNASLYRITGFATPITKSHRASTTQPHMVVPFAAAYKYESPTMMGVSCGSTFPRIRF